MSSGKNPENSGNLERFGYEQSLKRVLPLSFLIFYGLAYLSPVTIFSTYGLVTNMTHGMVSLTYTVATLAMVFTAYSYSQMSKVYPMAGSAYTYTQRSLNPYIGFLSGWAILMDYLLLPMINYLLAAIFLTPYFPGVPSWVWVLGYIIVVTFINYNGITITAWANNALIIVQFIFILAFVLFLAKWISAGGGAGTFFDWNAFLNPVEFNKPEMGWGVILSGASILALSFLGFDAVTTVSEEAINPEKNVGIAIMVTCIGAGLMFIVVSYLMQLSWPTAWNEFQVVDSGAQELIVKVAGSVMGYLFTATYCIGCLACAMSSHSSAARILFGMGRDGALPKKFFGYVHPKHQTPTYNVLLVGAVSLSALFLSLAAACSLINFGALAGFTLVNISVIAHYFIRHKQRGGLGVIRYLIVPLIGAAVCFTIWLNLDVHSKILGFSWLAVGIIYLAATTGGFKKLPPEMKLSE
jgi:amino acid transporter